MWVLRTWIEVEGCNQILLIRLFNFMEEGSKRPECVICNIIFAFSSPAPLQHHLSLTLSLIPPSMGN